LSGQELEAAVAEFGGRGAGVDLATARYSEFLELLDELRLRLLARGVELRDRLDAQSLVWWVTSAGPPESWTPDEKEAFLCYQRGDSKAPMDVADTPSAPVALRPADEELAHRVYLPREWLQSEIIELLAEKRQVIFYGPPGTGKTFVAQRLADHLTADG